MIGLNPMTFRPGQFASQRRSQVSSHDMGFMGAFNGAPLIITVGDSITQFGADPGNMGFQSLLANDYVRKADVVNRGLAGWTTRGWLPKVPLLIEEWRGKPPALVTIFLGANDAALIDKAPEQHVPLDEYDSNLHHMIALLRAAFPTCAILLITPPLVDDARCPSRANFETKKYAAECVRVGAALDVPVLDLWSDLQGRPDLLVDGLHFNQKGNVVAHQLIVDAIAKSFPRLTPAALPSEF
ncbi:Aste57867_11967 [Aphanomyces stellatus]|uniref:Aste57867_11967 protein n=1 Tax=Aphanomyces stellatus TaxID=120398 RepID=A0A485KUB9_9STRA|nr:hypothetical protein As57867_011922 [Aphanomyces stellatus]VFT88822.1 Aste57867_11967 [Aphanomyces stellatus]